MGSRATVASATKSLGLSCAGIFSFNRRLSSSLSLGRALDCYTVCRVRAVTSSLSSHFRQRSTSSILPTVRYCHGSLSGYHALYQTCNRGSLESR